MDLPAIIEALLVASEDPLPASELARLVRARAAEAAEAAGSPEEEEDPGAGYGESAPGLRPLLKVSAPDVLDALGELNRSYELTGRAFTVLERAKGWKIYTRPEYAGFVRHLFPGQKPRRLSAPAMETLSIVAYRQPVTKSAIEAVRGVSCDGMLQKLLDLELIRIQGRADLPGRPLLYETTDLFFEHFGLKSIDDLPNARELRHVPLPEGLPEESAPSPAAAEQLPLEAPSGSPPDTPGDE